MRAVHIPVVVRVLGAVGLLVGLMGPGAVAGQDAKLTNAVDTTLVTVGDHIRLTVTVEHAAGARVVWPDSVSLAPFEVLGVQTIPPPAAGDPVRTAVVFTLAAFELGELEIPSFDIVVEGPGETIQTLPTDRFGVEVVSVGQDETGDIRTIRGPMEIPIGALTIGLWLLAFLALVLLAVWLYRRSKNRPGGPYAEPPAPLRPAEEVALEALARIAASDQLLRGEVKEYHIDVSDVLRHYVEARFGVPALEMTTREVMEGLDRSDAEGDFRTGLLRFLSRCDLVKFAKVRPDSEESQAVLELGRELVRTGGPRPAATRPEEPHAEPRPGEAVHA